MTDVKGMVRTFGGGICVWVGFVWCGIVRRI